MNTLARRLPLFLMLATLLAALAPLSCGDSNEPAPAPAPPVTLADSVALFGYDVIDNRFFVQHVTSKLGDELNHGLLAGGHYWQPMTSFTVGGKQYIMGHDTNTNDWFIQEVYTSGDLGNITSSGRWLLSYETLVGLTAGDSAFIFGQDSWHQHYFTQRVSPGGILGAEIQTGEWGDFFGAATALSLNNYPCLFLQTTSDSDYFKTMCMGNNDGWIFERDHGSWGNFWPTLASYRAGNNTYLFTHRKRYDAGKATYVGPWSIVRISDNGQVWGDTDDGEWGHYYQTMTTYFHPDSGMHYLAGMNTDKHVFLQPVDANGRMQGESDSADWGHYFDYFSPIAVDSKYVYVDAWMGGMISTIGDRKLYEIAFPGSHDAGMNDNDWGDCYPSGTAKRCNTITQQGDVAFQLGRGSRYFDIRPVLGENSDGTDNWRTGHTTKKGIELYGCKGEDRDSIASALNNFFSSDNHSSELVILKVSHCVKRHNGMAVDCSENELSNVAKGLADKLEHLVTCDPDCNLMDTTLNDTLKKGHVIVVVSGERIDSSLPEIKVDADPPHGIFKFGGDGTCDFCLYDEYSNSHDFDYMRDDQFNKLLTTSNHYADGKRSLFLLSWTLTLGGGGAFVCTDEESDGILYYSYQAQWRLYNELVNLLNAGSVSRDTFPNILYVDDFNGTATRAAMYLNDQYEHLVSLTQKATLKETTDGPPSIGQFGTGAAERALLTFGSQGSPRQIVTLTASAGSTTFGDKLVWADTTSTFPAAGTFGAKAAVAWTGLGNNAINFRLTDDGRTFGPVFTDWSETSASHPVAVDSRSSDLVVTWQGADGRMNVKTYPDGTRVGSKFTLSESTKYGTSLSNDNGILDVTGVSGSGSFFFLRGDSSYGFSAGGEFPNEVTIDTVDIAGINNHIVLAWTGSDNRINFIVIDGARWYKATLDERSGSAPSIANIQGRLYLAWRGMDNAVNVAIVAGL